MNLAEMLLFADIRHVSKIADHYDCQCDRHSKQDMIQSLIYKITQKNTMINSLEQLNETEHRFIMLLYLDQRNQYTMEDLLAKGKKAVQIPDNLVKPRDLILMALKKGWIFQGVGQKNALVYLIPLDLKKKILDLIRTKFLGYIRNTNELPFYRDERNLIVGDCQTFLKFLLNEEVLLTGEGNIYKRQQQMLFNQFVVKEEPLKKQGWRFGYGRRYNEYPDRFSLIYDYVFYKKLITEDTSGFLSITDEGKAYLERGNISEITKDMYQFWVRLYKTVIPHLPLIVRLIDLIGNEQWIKLSDLKESILYWLSDHYYETKEMIFDERIIKMLHHLGMVQIGQDDSNTYIRITKEGHKYIHAVEIFRTKEIKLK